MPHGVDILPVSGRPTPPPPRPSRAGDFFVSVAAICWFFLASDLAARSAAGISQRLDSLALGSVLKPLFLLFLLAVGYSALELASRRQSSTRTLLGLPRRPTSAREWATGAAIGWAALLLAVLPVAMFGALRVQMWTEPRAFVYLAANLLGAALGALAVEVGFRGYAFRRLIEAIGPTGASILLSLLFGLVFGHGSDASLISVTVLTIFGLLLSRAWLRTYGLWLGWGLGFGWIAAAGILFGLPVGGSTDLSSVVQTVAVGGRALTGGRFGLEAAPFTAVVLLFAAIALIRLTRDYSWNYTHRPIVPGGYPVEVRPPAAHAAVAAAEESNRPVPLVQILPATPEERSAPPPPPR